MNVLYLHSHDTGRYIQPYGYPVPTPNLQRLADQGILFRRAFSAASTCSGSRAALITGEYPHRNGMMGLAHRGWTLNDYGHHLLHTLRPAGYHSELIGEQHVSADPDVIGYDEVHDITSNHVATVAPLAVERLRAGLPEPFFLSVGFFETHRKFFEPSTIRDELYSAPPVNLPDTPAVRRDVAAFKASARHLDQGVGNVLAALDENGLGERTLVICTTDHGLPFPGAKATLYRPRDRRAADAARAGRPVGRARDRRPRLAPRPLPDGLRAGGHRAAGPARRRVAAAAGRAARWSGCTSSSTRRSPTTRPTSRSARSAPSASSTSAASATTPGPCCPTATTGRPRTS